MASAARENSNKAKRDGFPRRNDIEEVWEGSPFSRFKLLSWLVWPSLDKQCVQNGGEKKKRNKQRKRGDFLPAQL